MDYSQMTASGKFYQDGIFTVVQPVAAVGDPDKQQEYHHFVADEGATNDSCFTLTYLIKLLTSMYIQYVLHYTNCNISKCLPLLERECVFGVMVQSNTLKTLIQCMVS